MDNPSSRRDVDVALQRRLVSRIGRTVDVGAGPLRVAMQVLASRAHGRAVLLRICGGRCGSTSGSARCMRAQRAVETKRAVAQRSKDRNQRAHMTLHLATKRWRPSNLQQHLSFAEKVGGTLRLQPRTCSSKESPGAMKSSGQAMASACREAPASPCATSIRSCVRSATTTGCATFAMHAHSLRSFRTEGHHRRRHRRHHRGEKATPRVLHATWRQKQPFWFGRGDSAAPTSP